MHRLPAVPAADQKHRHRLTIPLTQQPDREFGIRSWTAAITDRIASLTSQPSVGRPHVRLASIPATSTIANFLRSRCVSLTRSQAQEKAAARMRKGLRGNLGSGVQSVLLIGTTTAPTAPRASRGRPRCPHTCSSTPTYDPTRALTAGKDSTRSQT